MYYLDFGLYRRIKDDIADTRHVLTFSFNVRSPCLRLRLSLSCHADKLYVVSSTEGLFLKSNPAFIWIKTRHCHLGTLLVFNPFCISEDNGNAALAAFSKLDGG